MSFSIYSGSLHAPFPKFQIIFHLLTVAKRCLLARWVHVSFDDRKGLGPSTTQQGIAGFFISTCV
jgi:hypothetical protein